MKHWVIGPILTTVFRPWVKGLENVPRTGPVIVVCNHLSFVDSVFLPPELFSTKKAFIGDACPENRFSLCYDDKIDGPVLDKLFETKANVIEEMEEEEFSDNEDVHDDE